jgi:hypothetical protein
MRAYIETLLIDRLEEECWTDRPDLKDLTKAMTANGRGEAYGYTLEQDSWKNIWFITPERETIPITIEKEKDGSDWQYVCRVG